MKSVWVLRKGCKENEGKGCLFSLSQLYSLSAISQGLASYLVLFYGGNICECMAWDYTSIVCHESLVRVGKYGDVQPMLQYKDALGVSVSNSNDQLMTTEISKWEVRTS